MLSFKCPLKIFIFKYIFIHSQTWPYIFQVPEMSDLPSSIKHTDKKKNSLQTDDESRKIRVYDTFHSINMNYQNDSDSIYD